MTGKGSLMTRRISLTAVPAKAVIGKKALIAMSGVNGSLMKHILCEGHKYGLAGWFASQWISDKEAVAALEQASLRVHFRPDKENARLLVKRLSQESTGHL